MHLRQLPLTFLALTLYCLPARAGPDRIARYSIEAAQEVVRTLSVVRESSYIQLAGDLTIQNIFLGDRSQLVYATNVPIETGQAKIAYFVPIQKQTFPGALPANAPHLQITARDARGELRVFTVRLVLGGDHPRRAIIGDASAPQPATMNAHLLTQYGQATVHDLEAGLQVAIARESLLPTSETALKINNFIALWRNGRSVQAAQAETQLSWAVLERLAEDGQVARARERRDRFEENEARISGKSNPVADGARRFLPPAENQ